MHCLHLDGDAEQIETRSLEKPTGCVHYYQPDCIAGARRNGTSLKYGSSEALISACLPRFMVFSCTRA